MDQISLVEKYITDGQKLIFQLASDGFDVSVAAWINSGEDDWRQWYFYIGSKIVDEKGLLFAYRAVRDSLQKAPGISISFDEIKLIENSDAMFKELVRCRRLLFDDGPAWAPKRLGALQIDEMVVHEALVYPPLGPLRATAAWQRRRLKTDVERTAQLDKIFTPLTRQENQFMAQITASGINTSQAEYWVRARRKQELEKQPPIPAETVVDAQIVSWWGDRPEDDPNPLLLVRAKDGSEGYTFMKNTELCNGA